MDGETLNDIPTDCTETTTSGETFSKQFDISIPDFSPAGTYDVTISTVNADET